jgi:protein tyrosine/serine phosphatase
MPPIVPKTNPANAEPDETPVVSKPGAVDSPSNPSPAKEIQDETKQDAEDARETLGGDAVDLLENAGNGQTKTESAAGYELPDLFFDLKGFESGGLVRKTGDQKQAGAAQEPVPMADGQKPPAGGQVRPGDGVGLKAAVPKPVDASQEKGDQQTEKTPAQKLKDFDANYDEILKRLDKEIATEKVGLEVMTDVLKKARAESLSLRMKTGNGLALEEDATAAGDKVKQEAYAKQLVELKKQDKTVETNERRIFDHLPDATKSRSMKALLQIASGKDDQIQKGEIELCRLVKENPQLATNKSFRDLVMVSYAEMAATRELRELGAWQPKVKVEDIVEGKSEPSAKQDPIELLTKANESFFQDGIEKATPLFKEAIDAQKSLNQQTDRKRLGLFIDSLKQDATIAQDAQAGEEVDRLIAKRVAHKELEQKALEESLTGTDTDSSIRMNFAFARIATGKPPLYEEAMKDLDECLKDNPAMSFDEGFQTSARQAFKAYVQNRKAIDESVAKGDKEEVKPKFKELDLTKIVHNDEAKTASKVESYLVDDLTGPALLALGLGLALAQAARTRSKHHAATIMREGLNAASEVKAIEDLKPDLRAERPARSGELAKFEVKGTARDGRIVLLRDSTTIPAPETPQADFKEVKPGKSFSPETFQFDQYTPISVDGKQFFADKDGRAYKLEHKMFSEPRLFEDKETRQIEVVPRKEVQALLPEVKVIPEALEMTHEHPQKAMPKAWQREFDFVRDLKRSFAETDTHVSSRLETIDRAVKGLNDTAHGDRVKYLAELSKQMQRVGLKVEYSDQPGPDAREVKVYISEPGSDRRLVISGDIDKPSTLEIKDKEGKFTKIESGRVKVVDELSRLEGIVSKNLKTDSVKEKLRATDPELDKDASRKEVRRSFVDGLSKDWRDAHQHTQKFADLLRGPEGALKASLATMMTELSKASPEVTTRVLAQVEREFKAIGLDAKAELSIADGGKSKVTLSVVAPDGKGKLHFVSDGSKPTFEPDSALLPGVVVNDERSLDKVMAELSKRAGDVAKGKVSGTADGALKKTVREQGEASFSKSVKPDAPVVPAEDPAKVMARAEALIDKSDMLQPLKDAYKKGLKDQYLTPELVERIFSIDPSGQGALVRESLFDRLLDPKRPEFKVGKEGFAALAGMSPQSLTRAINNMSLVDLESCLKGLDGQVLTTKAMESMAEMSAKERPVWMERMKRCLENKGANYTKADLQKILELSPSARATFLPGGAFDTVLANKTFKGDLGDILSLSKNPGVYLKLDEATRGTLLVLDSDSSRQSLENLLARTDVDQALIKKILDRNSTTAISSDIAAAYYGVVARGIVTPDQLNKILDLDKPTVDAFNKLLFDQNKTGRTQELSSSTIDLLLKSKPTAEVLEIYRTVLEGQNKIDPLLNDSKLASVLKTSSECQQTYQELLKNRTVNAEAIEKLLANNTDLVTLKAYQKAAVDKVLSPAALATLLSMPEDKRSVFEQKLLPGELNSPRALGESLFSSLLNSDLSAHAVLGIENGLADGMKPDVLEKVMQLESPVREQVGTSLRSGDLVQEHLTALISSDTKLSVESLARYTELVSDLRSSKKSISEVTLTSELIRKTAPGAALSVPEAFEAAALMHLSGQPNGADAKSVTDALSAMEKVKSVRAELKLDAGGLREPMNIIQIKENLALPSYTDAKKVSDNIPAVRAAYRTEIGNHPSPNALALNMAMVLHKSGFELKTVPEDASIEEHKKISAENKTILEMVYDDADLLTRVREQNRDLSFEQASDAAKHLREIGGPKAAMELAREIMLRGPSNEAGMRQFLIDYAGKQEVSDKSKVKEWQRFREVVAAGEPIGKALAVVSANLLNEHSTVVKLAESLTASEIASITEPGNLTKLVETVAFETSWPDGKEVRTEALQRKMIEATLERYVNRLAPEISAEKIGKLLAGLPEADRAKAIEYIKSRVDFTSKPAARKQFKDIQAELVRGGFVTETTNQPGSHGQKGQMIRAYCLTSEGEALAQDFRKATGLAVEIVRPGDVIPKGSKVVLFDSPSKAKTTAAASIVIPSENQLVLTGESTQLQKLTADGSVRADKYLSSYSEGLNARDLAAMKGNPELAFEKIRKAIGSTATDTTTGLPPTEKQIKEVHEALNRPIQQRRSEMFELGKEHLLPADSPRKSGSEYLQRTMIETARSALNPNLIDGERMMQQARALHQTVLEKSGVKANSPLPKNVIFVAMNRNPAKEMWADSAHKAVQVYREANGLTDARHDQNFLTPDQLRARMVDSARTGEQLYVFALNDSTNTGGEAKDILARMAKMTSETKAKAEVRYASFMGYEGGIEHATGNKGDSIITGDAPIKELAGGPEFRVREGLSEELKTRIKSKQSKYVRFTTEAVHEDGYSISLPNSQSELLDAMDHPRWQSETRVNENRYDGAEGAARRSLEFVRISDTANVGRISENLMRGGKPYTEQAIKELKANGVNVIIDLTTHGSEQEAKWCRENGIEYVHKPLTVTKLTVEQVNDAVGEIQRQLGKGKNCFVHCVHGKDRTGAVMVNMRMQQNWTSAQALVEMEAYGITPEHANKLYGLAGENIVKTRTPANPSATTGDASSGQTPAAAAAEKSEFKAGSVPHYEDLPRTADRDVAEINDRVAEVFKGVSAEKFKTMDAVEKQKLVSAAVEKILPLMRQYAQRLGLPQDLIKPETITFDALPGASGKYLIEQDRIVLDINLRFPANEAFHELVHKMRALDLKAAFTADPAGARLALMDRMLGDGAARIRVGSEIIDRPKFTDPKLAAEYRQQVEFHILNKLHKDGVIDASQVPPKRVPGADLIKAFASEADMFRAIANEVGNFTEACDLVERTKLSKESNDYVEAKAKGYRNWIEHPKGTAVVRLAVHEVLTGEAGKGTAAEKVKAVRERVALLTAERKGDATSGIQVTDELVKQVMESYSKSDPRVEALIAKDNARLLFADGAARREFESPARSLRTNPYVEKLLLTTTIDRVARVAGGEPEYSFANDELAARKGDIAERAKRINREMKTGELDPQKLAESQKAFAEFVDYLKLASEQQRLNKALATENITEARALALKMLDKMSGNAENKGYADFLLMNGLISPDEHQRVAGKPLAERIATAPAEIQPGLLKLKELGIKGWESLAADILSLHERGELPTKARLYLDKTGSGHLTTGKIELLNTIVATAKSSSQQSGKPPSSATTAGGTAGDVSKLPGADTGAPREPFTERHDSFGFGAIGTKAKDLMVRISYTGPDQVTVEKMVPLLDVPPDELRKRLDGLTKEKIADMLAKGENELKKTEGDAKFAEERKALEAKMESLRELQKLHEGYESAKKGGRELEYCKETQARLKGTHGSHPGRTALAIAGKAGLASALLLLFNDLVPEVKLGGPSVSDRVNPGSAK